MESHVDTAPVLAPQDAEGKRSSKSFFPQVPWRGALVEGFAVLAGVLMAFAIDAWWDSRSDRVREAQYVAAIKAELLGNRQAVNDHIQQMLSDIKDVSHYLNTVVAANAQTVSDSAIHAMVWNVGPYYAFVPARAAFDDLIASGGLQLIRSDTLRRAIAAYGQALTRDAVLQEGALNSWRNGLAPYYGAHANLRGMLPGGSTEGVSMPELPYPMERLAFLGNRTFANMLIGRAEARSV